MVQNLYQCMTFIIMNMILDTDPDSDSQMTDHNFPVSVSFQTDSNIQWQKPLSITGKSGTPKNIPINLKPPKTK